MPTKKSARAELNNLAKGFITEASPVNFPIGATLDEQNFELNKDGTRDRRLGMNFEQNFEYRTVNTISNKPAFNTFRWKNPGGVANTESLVVQVDNKLLFYRNDRDTISKNFLQEFSILLYESRRVSITSVGKFLVVTSGSKEVQAFTYSDAGVISSFTFRLKIRDLFGVDDLYSISGSTVDIASDERCDYRPNSVTGAHAYNLRNQSWAITRQSSKRGGFKDPIEDFEYECDGEYPSNSDAIWPSLYNKSAAEEVFSGLKGKRSNDGKTPAAKGFFIIDALDRGTSRLAEYQSNQTLQKFTTFSIANLPLDSTPGGPTSCAEFASHVFYAGFSGAVVGGDSRSPDLSTYILFSRLIKTTEDLGRCYQDGDPTGRGTSDVVDTDGGFIRISGAKNITNLVALNDSLIVIAENGVWVIAGGNQYGFTATNYKVDMVSSFGSIAKWSAVSDGVKVFYWSDNGICVVAKNQYGDFVWESLTEKTIKRFYENIELTSPEDVTGVLDVYENRIRWVYRIGDRFASGGTTNELIFDLTLNAFYRFRVYREDTGPELLTAFNTPSFRVADFDDDVYVGLDSVFSGSDMVIIDSSVRQEGLRSVKYLAAKRVTDTQYQITFSSYSDPNFLDWNSYVDEGLDAFAYLVTGAMTADDTAIHKQVPYLIMHFKRTENGFEDDAGDLIPINQSSCIVQSQWDWANTSNSNKWSSEFQAYRYRIHYVPTGVSDEYDTGFQLITTRNKIRGRGRAFSFYMKTEPGKDCRMVGWSISVNGNSYA